MPNPLMVANNGAAGSITLSVNGDTGPWDWSGYVDDLSNSVLTAPDAFNSPDLTINWAAGGLSVPGERGTITVTVQVTGGTRPSSVVDLPVLVQPFSSNGSGSGSSNEGGFGASPGVPTGATLWLLLAGLVAAHRRSRSPHLMLKRRSA